MIHDSLIKVVNKKDLDSKEMTDAMNSIMSGEVSEIELSAFLTALKMKGETVEEISSAAKVMREKASGVDVGDLYTLDTCGTGGDASGTYNISTAVAFVAAAAGIKVAKHGNRSMSSKCGSADVLEELGVKITLTPEQVKQCILDADMGFMFAPGHHSAMKYVMGVRRTLGYRTMFNILGPLSNPAGAKAQVLGVFDKELVEPLAKVLGKIGLERALVVHGNDGLDEISISDKTFVAELKDNVVTIYEIEPEMYGMSKAPLEEVIGGEAKENAEIVRGLFDGSVKGAKRDILVINAAAALYVGQKAKSMEDGIKLAKQLIDSGMVAKTLEKLIEVSNKA